MWPIAYICLIQQPSSVLPREQKAWVQRPRPSQYSCVRKMKYPGAVATHQTLSSFSFCQSWVLFIVRSVCPGTGAGTGLDPAATAQPPRHAAYLGWKLAQASLARVHAHTTLEQNPSTAWPLRTPQTAAGKSGPAASPVQRIWNHG